MAGRQQRRRRSSDPLSDSSEDDDSPETLIKVVAIGDSGVGKSSLIERMFSDRFDPHLPSTIGCDQRFKRLHFNGRRCGVSVWDTAGQERFQALTTMFFRGAQGCLLVFDVTRRATLDALATKWLPEFKENAVPGAVLVFVGNKIDLPQQQREVSPEEGAAFARAHGGLYRETSAKLDTGGRDGGVYDALFYALVATILESPELLHGGGGGAGGGGVQLGEQRRRRGGGGGGGCC